MSNTQTIKCPSCGSYLVFDPESQRLTCPFCGAAFTQQQLEARIDAQKAANDTAHTREYHCSSCGAELVTDDTTAATFCYYCHNPVTLVDRVSEEFHPDGVIPFAISKENAMKRFQSFLAKKKFVRRDFFSAEALEKFSGVYYPYWVGDIEGSGDYLGQGTRVSIASTPKYDIVTTKYYDVHRAGSLRFSEMMRQALTKNDRKLSDGIYPYQFKDTKPFSTALLSGYMAEKRDIGKDSAEQEMVQEACGQVEKLMTSELHYDTLHGKASFTPTKAKMRYFLLPTWVITYRGDKPGTTFYYMMNAQTGTVCGKLPIRWGKLIGVATLAGAIVSGLLCAGGALLW